MQRANSLTFESFSRENAITRFTFLLDTEPVTITLTHALPISLPEKEHATVFFNIGMCYLHDLAELTLPEKIHINFGISDLQLEFWKRTYQEASQEKVCIDRLPLEVLDGVWTRKSSEQEFAPFSIVGERSMTALCLTGGKESLVLLKELRHQTDLLLFFLNPETSVHRQKVYDRVKDEFPTTRTISNRPEVFKKIKQKYQTDLGSGVDMAHLIFNTMLYGSTCKQVVIGNEYSSNFPNLVYQGYNINHQYVKSIYFARRINSYIHHYVTPDYTYYSPFFGMYEYRIAQYLFKSSDYLEVWTSCNRTTATVNFCCNCAKCAFTYLVSLMYSNEAFLQKYFSRDLLEDVVLYKPLMDFTGEKPLDCVGEKKEVWVGLWKLSQNPEQKDKPVVRYFMEKIYPFIAAELPHFEEELLTIQKVPQQLPAELIIK